MVDRNVTSEVAINQLKEEAKKLLSEGRPCLVLRTCWVCNPAHEHLKKIDEVIYCFSCDGYFYKGVEITEKEEEAENRHG